MRSWKVERREANPHGRAEGEDVERGSTDRKFKGPFVAGSEEGWGTR